MKRSTPIRRSGLGRREPRPAKQIDYTPRPRAAAVARADVPARLCVPVPKVKPVRNKSYRMLVARLACICCGIAGQSQCAHANAPAAGKALAMRADDRETFPLCHHCHRLFDQGAMFSKEQRREIEPLWANKTRMALRALASQEPKVRAIVEKVIGT